MRDFRLAAKRFANVRHRADTAERDRFCRIHDCVDKRADTVFLHVARVFCEVVSFRPRPLWPDGVSTVHADCHGDVGTTGGFEVLRGEPGAEFGVAVVGKKHAQIDLGRLQEHRQRPRVVDVVANIGIENHGNRSARFIGHAVLPLYRNGARTTHAPRFGLIGWL